MWSFTSWLARLTLGDNDELGLMIVFLVSVVSLVLVDSGVRRKEGVGTKLRGTRQAAGCPIVCGNQANRLIRGGNVPILVMVKQKAVIIAIVSCSLT
jgi:hypothetical protein